METTKPQLAADPRRRALLLATLALLVVAAAAVLFVRAQLDPGPPVSGVTEAAVRDDTFVPAAIAVPAGTTVTWRWQGEDEHNVVGDGFASPAQVDGTFAHAFAAPGSYDYQCTLHTFMRGRVVVQ
jgi:plastocyanin